MCHKSKPWTMRNKNKIEVSKKEKIRDALHEMMKDMIGWEYKNSFGDKSLLEVLREKYIIEIKPNQTT